jgi:hypothetical protein
MHRQLTFFASRRDRALLSPLTEPASRLGYSVTIPRASRMAADAVRRLGASPISALQGKSTATVARSLRSLRPHHSPSIFPSACTPRSRRWPEVQQQLYQTTNKGEHHEKETTARMNNGRIEWAAAASRHFQSTTGSDYEDAPGDLLCDLMHWCDRNNFDFELALCRARGHYEAETMR